MSCLSSACAVKLSEVQTSARSSNDLTTFNGAKTLFAANYSATAPVFKSNADYMRWKRARVQLQCCGSS
jgi:hypothetical protein